MDDLYLFAPADFFLELEGPTGLPEDEVHGLLLFLRSKGKKHALAYEEKQYFPKLHEVTKRNSPFIPILLLFRALLKVFIPMNYLQHCLIQ